MGFTWWLPIDDMKPCIKTNTYQVKLPKNGKELLDWAGELHNCMTKYFKNIKKHKTIIYCFFQEDILAFAVEICDNKIVQAQKKYNFDLVAEEEQVLMKWFELFFTKDVQKQPNLTPTWSK